MHKHQLSEQTMAPSLQPIPDFRRNNRMTNTSSPIRQVKSYLQSIKLSHRQHEQQSDILFDLDISNEDQSSKTMTTEKLLRKRIEELQRENNEYRTYAHEYEKLTIRNTELEQQMAMLLEQIQLQQNENIQTQNNIYETKNIKLDGTSNKLNYFRTTESEQFQSNEEIQSIVDKYSIIQSVKPFNSPSNNEKTLIEENLFLKAQNLRIKEVIEDTIKQSIQVMETKFSNYVDAMEQKMKEISITNQQIAKMHLQSEQSRSISSSLNSIGPKNYKSNNLAQSQKDKDKSQSSHRSLSQSNSEDIEKYEVNIPQTNQQFSSLKESSKKMDKQSSMIRIELSNVSSSNNVKNETPRSHTSNYFSNVLFVESEQRSESVASLISKIEDNLASIRSNLAAISSQSRIRQSPIRDISRKIERQLKDIIVEFFPKDNEALLGQNENLLSESIQMRQKIKDLSNQISSLKHDLKVKVDEDLSESPFKRASQKYLEESYYYPVMIEERQQFQQTKKKLMYVIDVMKSFNEDYQHILNSSRRASIVIESINS